MVLQAGIRFPFDTMTPAYDLEFDPSVMCFRAPGLPRDPAAAGTTVFVVRANHEVCYADPHDCDTRFVFRCSPAEYDRLKNLYEGGRHV